MTKFGRVLVVLACGYWLFACGSGDGPIITNDVPEDGTIADVPIDNDILTPDVVADRLEDLLTDALHDIAIDDNITDADIDVITGCQSDEDCLPDGAELGLCEYPSCNRATGECSIKDMPDGSMCELPNACWSAKKCSAGECLGVAISCDDFNPCTDDSCDPTDGCIHGNNIATCDDGNTCTKVDSCSEGICLGTQNECDCAQISDCSQHEDGNPCNGTLNCVDLKCAIDQATIVICTQDETNPCSRSVCNPDDGACKDENVNNGSSCEDGDMCTNDDLCGWGKCNGGPAANCDDNNECTADTCEADKGCVFTNQAGDCSDGNKCTEGDTCVDGLCAGSTNVDCNDDNQCTLDSCDPMDGCIHTNVVGSCNDGNACTTEDQCEDGNCAGGTATNCNDNNICTTDSCNPATGCVFTNNTSTCNDGSVCTTKDTCADGVCVGGTLLNCDDEKQCTVDSCDPVNGCQYENLTTACSDNNACTVGDMCQDGDCIPGSAAECDDDNICTTDTCSTETGCVNTPRPGSPACNDNNNCTVDDACTVDGRCVGVGQQCDDGNQCTEDTCNAGTGCAHFPISGKCEDGNNCTSNDYCENSQCKSGTALSCDDRNVCTTDTCNPATGCVNTNNTVACEDGNLCTLNDKCANGSCVPGTDKNCNDSNPCTGPDQCLPANGNCQNPILAGTSCNTNACLINMMCNDAGVCTGGGAKCDDGLNCTNDSCSNGVCTNTARTGEACDDGSICTSGDACQASGACSGSPVCSQPNPRCASSTGNCYCENGGVKCGINSDRCIMPEPRVYACMCGTHDACPLKQRCVRGMCVL